MIPFKNGNQISTICISTAFGHGTGIFPYTLWKPYQKLFRVAEETKTTRFLKSVTRQQRIGNVRSNRPWTWWKYVRKIGKDGMLNAYGLTNRGVDFHVNELPGTTERQQMTVVNYYPEFEKGIEQVIKDAIGAFALFTRRSFNSTNFCAYEINLSCPNVGCVEKGVEDATKLISILKKIFPSLNLIAKVGLTDDPEYVQELERAGVDAIHSINTIPYKLVYPKKDSPLKKVGGGGISGGPAFDQAYHYNRFLRKKIDIPMIMGCGVVNDENLKHFFDIGADSISICTAALRNSNWVKEKIIYYNI